MADRATAGVATKIVIPPLRKQMLQLVLVGDAPLIMHQWSEKAKTQMRDAQSGKARDKKAVRDPHAEFQASIYRLPDGRPGFPVVAFKAAAVDACSFVEGLTKVMARGMFFIGGELIPIEGPEPTMREDMVRVGMGTADLRYRAEFWPWKAALPVVYDAAVIQPEVIVHLFSKAGFSIGVGEWRPQRDGEYGRFHVATPEEAQS